jgi:N-acetylmuramoyl-L-alanine amidase-like protein
MGIYYTQFVDVLRQAGCQVAESSITNGWQNRARSSGGFPTVPLGVQWHHTASKTSPANDLSWQIDGCDDAPVGNCLLDRTGTFWPVAAGAANTAGKGGPLTLSRGTIPVDSANTRSFAFEVANDGVGEGWPQVQVDAYFRGSNAINAMLGNRPDDVFSHALGEGNGWTDRKIDPATANAVQGPWKPRSVNSSGTWSLTDIRNECLRRAGSVPAPIPTPPNGDDEMVWVLKGGDSDTYWAWNGVTITGIPGLNWVQAGCDLGIYKNSDPIIYSQSELDALIESQGER